MQNLSVLLTDAGGNTGVALLHLQDSALLTDGLGALIAESNADWVEWWGSTATLQAVPSPTAAPFAPLRPAARLSFSCADGSVASVVYRSPKLALFLADQETVDPSDPTGVLAALQAIICSQSGSPATAFIGGSLE